MMLRLWFRFLGLVLLLLILWGSLWAGFQNFNPFAGFGRTAWFQATASVILNYGLVYLGIWMLRGGPELIRKQK